MTATEATKADAKQQAKHNPDDWAIVSVNFLSKMGSPITGSASWSALSGGQQDRSTTVIESPNHITLVYEAGDVRQRWDVAKTNVDICRIPAEKLAKMRAALPGGR